MVANEVVILSLDVYAVAEKVASIINSKVGSRLEQLEQRVRQIEAIVGQLHSSTIEAVVRSMLYVKMDELAKAIALRVAGSLSTTVSQLQTVTDKLREITLRLENELASIKAIGKITDKLNQIDNLLEKLENIAQLTPEQTDKLASSIDEITYKLEHLEKKLDQISKNLPSAKELKEISNTIEKMLSEIRAIENILSEIREDGRYARQVLRAIEVRLQEDVSEGGE